MSAGSGAGAVDEALDGPLVQAVRQLGLGDPPRAVAPVVGERQDQAVLRPGDCTASAGWLGPLGLVGAAFDTLRDAVDT